jgi:uncharacterized membrane protein YfcA
VPDDPVSLSLVALIIGVAALTQGVLGFSFGLVSMAGLPLLLGIDRSVALVSVWSAGVNLSIFLELRKHLDRSKVLPLLIGGLFGIPVGVFLLKRAPGDVLRLVFGLVVLGWAVQSMLAARPDRDVADRWGPVAGFFGGMLGGALNSGGPPAVMYVSRKTWEPDAVRATLQAFFLEISTVQLTLYTLTGVFTQETLRTNLLLAPVVLAGVIGGVRLGRAIDREAFRRLLLASLSVTGVVYVVRASIALLPA